MVLIAAALICFCQFAAAFCALLLVRRYIRRRESEIRDQLLSAAHEWIDPQGENADQPSKLADAIAQLGEIMGRAAARSLMSQLAASNSHAAKVAGGISDTVEAQTNPLGLIAGAVTRGKGGGIARLAQLLAPMLGGLGGSGPGPGRAGNHETPRQGSFDGFK